MLVYSKIRAVRKFLKLNQDDLANLTQLSQHDISFLEAGKRRFIPLSLLEYFQKKDINLSALVDETYPIEVFEENPKSQLNAEPCRKCIDKDEKIADLRDTIVAQKDAIEQLKARISILNVEGRKSPGARKAG